MELETYFYKVISWSDDVSVLIKDLTKLNNFNWILDKLNDFIYKLQN